ncbi:glycosyltransferase family 4 protein [Niallia taxi]|uniref:glycosyltransferase family 4 protein n=1 Tax=Niallia taxi TaxID=2499688 RepID=UPI00300B011F
MKNKILIDGYYLSKPRGMGRYVKELIYALGCTNATEDYEIYITINDEETRNLLTDISDRFKIIRGKNLPFPIWEQLYIPYIVKKLKIDILLSPYNTYPVISNIINVRNIITIHDLMFLNSEGIGGNSYQKLGNVYRKMIVKSITKKPLIISVSENTSKEIHEKLKLSSTVIYTAIDYFFDQNKSLENKAKVDKSYYYHVGGVSPHKNTERVIQAFSQMDNADELLVISGLPEDNKLKEKYMSVKNIIFTGWLEDIEVANLYKFAKGVIFPSLVEGYGLPIIEAFKYGTPVITSNIPPMSEIANSAAILVDPYSIESIKDGLKELNNEGKIIMLKEKMQVALEEINSSTMGEKIKTVLNNSITK